LQVSPGCQAIVVGHVARRQGWPPIIWWRCVSLNRAGGLRRTSVP
jgi:hypothetical protein